MKQIPSAPELAVVTGDFDQYSPAEVFDLFTDPDRLVEWWPAEASVDLRLGGAFRFSWPQNDWHLRGEYTAVDPGRHLGFTWSWDHEPSHFPAKQVDIWFEPVHQGGTRVAIYHGPFDFSESDQQARQGIVEGWIHFGMRLAGLRPGHVA